MSICIRSTYGNRINPGKCNTCLKKSSSQAIARRSGRKFTVFTGSSEVDESLEPDLRAQPAEAVKKLAERKAGAVVQEILAQNPVGLGIIIGADTTVVLDGEMYGKPYSADHAREMLARLSGRTHEVITGVSVWMILLNETEEKGGDGKFL